ncbi:MAG: helix-turn-helix domain-containing protein [Eubacteriales bacterium]
MSETINFRSEVDFEGLPVKVFNRHKIDAFGGYLNWHKEIEMIYLKTGSCQTFIDGTLYTLEPGDIAVASSNMMHHRLWFYGDCTFSVIQMNPDYFVCPTENAPPSAMEDICNLKKCFDILIRDPKMEELVLEVLKAWEERTASDSLGIRLIAKSCLLYAHMIDFHCHEIGSDSAVTRSDSRYVKDAILYINSHFTEPLSLSDIAGQMDISPSYLSHIFSLNTGITVSNYINEVRVQNAATLMKKGISVTEAAFASGFNSTSYFAKIFKKIKKVSPSHLCQKQLPDPPASKFG